jgi:hypothetical protein
MEGGIGWPGWEAAVRWILGHPEAMDASHWLAETAAAVRAV